MKPYFTRGNVTLYHGDCREVIPCLPKIDLVVTDPPYGLGKKLDGGSWGNVSEWDKSIEVDLLLSIDAEIIMWGGNNYPLPPCRGWLSWFKPDAPPTMGQFELAWRNVDCVSRQISYSIAATNPERCGHPTQKPLAVMAWSIRQSQRRGLILDPFVGSGTTLVAARDLMRAAIGIEANERYCEMAAERLSGITLFDELLDAPLETQQEGLFAIAGE